MIRLILPLSNQLVVFPCNCSINLSCNWSVKKILTSCGKACNTIGSQIILISQVADSSSLTVITCNLDLADPKLTAIVQKQIHKVHSTL